jgi:hypothetical protein
MELKMCIMMFLLVTISLIYRLSVIYTYDYEFNNETKNWQVRRTDEDNPPERHSNTWFASVIDVQSNRKSSSQYKIEPLYQNSSLDHQYVKSKCSP